MEENERNSIEAQPPVVELTEQISDCISRDSRRYPRRFNTENE